MKPLGFFAAAALLASVNVSQADMSDVAREIAVQRACQAGIWAMPAVSTWDIANATIRDLGGKIGDVVSLSQPMTSQHGFLTANDVTPYAIGSLTTKDGPLVVEVPPATDKVNFFGTFVDAWMRPVADVGADGTDEGKGGKYLFLPEGYDGKVPENGFYVFPLESYSINFAFRPVSKGEGTIADAVAHARTLRVYPLAQADNPPETTFLDATGKDWDTLPYYDETFFQDLNNVIQSEPVRERDKAMIGLLRTIGIEKGKTFEPTEEWTAIYKDGAQCVFRYLQDIFNTPGKLLVPYYSDDNQWQVINVPKEQAAIGFPFEDDGVPLIDLRAQNYFFVTYFPVKLGGSSFYLVALRDADGNFLNGTDTYKLNVRKDTPARDFWSAIAYSTITKGFIRDAGRVGLSTRQMDDMVVNDDGSVDLHFAPKALEGFEANWIPTGEDFFVMFRFYGPGDAVFDKSFVLGNIEKLN